MLTVPQLKAKLLKYGVKAEGLKKELEEALDRCKKTKEIHYEEPDYLEYTCVTSRAREDPRRRLEKHGWAIVPFPGWEEKYVTQFQELIEDNFDFRFDDSSAWMAKNLPYNLHGILRFNLAHSNLQWELREKAYPIFQQLFEEDDLLVSFDSLNLSYPRKRDLVQSWCHLDTDQRTYRNQCYQGVLNFLPNGDKDGGLILVDKSHLILEDYFKRHPSAGLGWWKVEMNDPEVKKLSIYKINIPPGHMCLWDSRVIHCNMQPQSSNLRLAAYISMQPRTYASEADLKRRILAFERGQVTGHWVGGRLFKVFTNPRPNSSLPVPKELDLKKEDLTPLQRKLVGYED